MSASEFVIEFERVSRPATCLDTLASTPSRGGLSPACHRRPRGCRWGMVVRLSVSVATARPWRRDLTSVMYIPIGLCGRLHYLLVR
jgi:hypothetical protein